MWAKFLKWARITMPGTDDQQFAVQQMEYQGKTAEGLMVFPYGLHGNVPADSLVLMFAVGGDADNRAGIGWTPKNRPQLQGGEVAFYHPPSGAIIKLTENGDIDITTGKEAGGNVNVNAAAINLNASGNVVSTVGGDMTATVTGSASIDCADASLTASGDLTVNCSTADITASSAVTIDSPSTSLGSGGNAIARVGDAVQVTVTGGSSAGTYSGTITAGGVNTSI